jgi:tetratricopeptide (TPR) repeat protein
VVEGKVASRASGRGPGGLRHVAFWLVLLATPLVLLALIEGLVRALGAGDVVDDPELVLSDVPAFFERRVVDGRPVVEMSHPEAYRGADLRIPARKEPNAFRIFCLGASASAGWPHPPGQSYCHVLEAALRGAWPGRAIEVFNVSAHAYPIYRVRLIFDQVLELHPDLLLLWTGNNEFLEHRTYLRDMPWLRRVDGLAYRLHAYRALRRGLVALLQPGAVLSAQAREGAEEGLRSKLAQMAVPLRRDPEQFEGVKRHYEATALAMAQRAAERGVPLWLLTVPVNLRDWKPNASRQDLSGEALAAWRRSFDAGRADLLRGHPEAAEELLLRAQEQEPLHAETHFLLGRAREAQGDHRAAHAHYVDAVDLDHNPFRAISAFGEALGRVAARVPGARLIDARAAMAAASAPRAPGFDLFLDYVHPTLAGNRVVAAAVFDALVESRLLGPGSPARGFEAPPPRWPDGRAYEPERDLRMQVTLLALFVTMHQYEAAVELARRLEAQGGRDVAMAQRVLQVFPAWLALDRDRLLGVPVSASRAERVEDAFRAFYARELAAMGGG